MCTLFLNVLFNGSVLLLFVVTLVFVQALFLFFFVLSVFCLTKQVLFQLAYT